MLAGELYRAGDGELTRERNRARALLRQLNQTDGDPPEERLAILAQLLGGMGEGCWVETPFRCDYGRNITVGRRFYANFDCLILDVCPVTIGDDVLLGPRVGIYTAAHPLDPEGRATGLELGRPITIGSRVWIGAGAILTPGVTIGEGSVIGAGAVVTRDVPAGVVAAGNPCRVLRQLGNRDREEWLRLAAGWDGQLPPAAETVP